MSEPTLFARKATGLVRGVSGTGALVNNINLVGFLTQLLGVVFISGLSPGIDIRIVLLLAAIMYVPISLLYPLLSATLPRSGGDYVWVSRIVHPAIGFTFSFVVLIAFVGGAIALLPAWAMQWGVASIFQGVGILNNDRHLIDLGYQVSSPLAVQIFGLICFSLLGLVVLRGVRLTFKVQWAMFLISVLGAIVYITTVLYGASVFQQRFDSMSGTTIATIVSSAASEGYATQLTIGGLLVGVVFCFCCVLNGFFWSSGFAGEIKEVKKSQLLAIVGGLIITLLIGLTMFTVTYYGIGKDFVGALSYLYLRGSSNYQLPLVAPLPHFLLPYLSDNPLPVILVGTAFAVGILASMLGSMLIVSRIIFAWSFDRVIGSRLAAVDTRRGSPYLALMVTVGLCMIFQAIYVYTNLLTYISYVAAAGFASVGVTGLAGVFLPYRRRDFFELAPSMVQRRIYGIPLVTLVGALTLGVCTAIVYGLLSPSFAGPFNYISAAALLLTYLIGAAVYFASSAYHRKKNPLELVFKGIPPE